LPEIAPPQDAPPPDGAVQEAPAIARAAESEPAAVGTTAKEEAEPVAAPETLKRIARPEPRAESGPQPRPARKPKPRTAARPPEAEPVREAPPVPLPSAPRSPAPPPEGGTVRILEPKRKDVARAPEEAKAGWFGRLKRGLSRTSSALGRNIAVAISGRRLDEAALEELEGVLLQADLGPETAARILKALADRRLGREVTDAQVREAMAAEIERTLAPVAIPLELDLSHRPHVVLVVGVNGTGKTTTIGKLAAKLKAAGLSPLLVAGDTFRAAAIEQLTIWGERTGCPVVARKLGADPAGLAFDAWEQARAGGHDVMLMDTAGRLQNKAELMAELEKIVRVIRKRDAAAPHTVLLTLDATTGQNALRQVEIFRDTAGVNGLVMTKLDGTARGGILVAIAEKFRLPVFFVGVGEQVGDLEPFEAGDFAASIAGVETGETA
jgi:fused signal recognition particle receptor